MIVESLKLINFKNIETADCRFSPKLNCFFGLNGMGKTNLLDALHYLAFVRSHLATGDALAVRYGTEMAVIEAHYRSDASPSDVEELLLSIRSGKRKLLRHNQKDYKKLSEHIGHFPLVIVSPQDQELIQGGSDERRRFVDQLLSQQSAIYLSALIRYNKSLQQRNTLLKNGLTDEGLMDIVEQQLEQYGRFIYEGRKRFVEDFVPIFHSYYQSISGESEDVRLTYETQMDDKPLNELLKQSRSRDLILGYTTVGPHKDDLGMWLGDELIRRVGSQGQRKSFLISLKFGQFAHLTQVADELPILLLDDVFDKLDAERMARIIALVRSSLFGQIFITDTNRTHLDRIITELYQDYRLFVVDRGRISKPQGTKTDETDES